MSTKREARARTILEVSLGALTAVAPLSIDMYLPAMPTLATELSASHARVELSLATFFIGFAVGQFLSGPLLDRFGRRVPLLFALALYTVGSIGCAAAPSIGWLLAFRGVAGLFGATAVVVPRAVVRDMATGAEAARILSRLLLVMGIAPILAPLLGGALLHAFGWRAIFLLLTLFGLAGIAISARVIPRGAPKSTSWGTSLAVLFRDPRFLRLTLAGGAAQAGMFAYITGSSFVFIKLWGVAPSAFGFFFGANALGLIAASQLNRRLLTRASPIAVARFGTAALLSGAVLVLAVSVTRAGGLFGTSAAFFVFVSSIGLVTPNTTALALDPHGAHAGVASAVMGSLQFALAAAASSTVSALHDETARPLGATIAALALAAFILVRAGRGESAARAG